VPVTFFFEGGSQATSYSVELPKAKKVPDKNEPDIRISVPQKNLDKFREVLLYVLEKVGAKPNVGETVIYKLLYFIDFDFYEKFEEQLIGATYIKNKYGPTPVEFKKIVEQMIKNGEIEAVRSKHFQYEQKKYLPLRRADLKKLNAQEINHIDDVLARLSDKNAKELSDYSHNDTPWMIHEMGESLDYELVFYRDEKHSVRNYPDEL
ncbi:MAG: Panacea domain-containing protein, partial [Patescibacteria group bacterium]